MPITEDCYMHGKLLGGPDCEMLPDTGTGKSFMSKTLHINCPSLHSLPKLVSKTKNMLVGNGLNVVVILVITVANNLHEYRYEVNTLVSEIHDNVNTVMGIKNIGKF